MIWNGDCTVKGCEREAVDSGGLCRRHAAQKADRDLALALARLQPGQYFDGTS